MRVWDIPPSVLCNQHILGLHAEVHAIWSIYANSKPGYRSHPEVERWNGHLPYLALIHDDVVEEMNQRGMNHQSPLSKRGSFKDAGHYEEHPDPITPIEEQRRMLRERCDDCLEGERCTT